MVGARERVRASVGVRREEKILEYLFTVGCVTRCISLRVKPQTRGSLMRGELLRGSGGLLADREHGNDMSEL